MKKEIGMKGEHCTGKLLFTHKLDKGVLFNIKLGN